MSFAGAYNIYLLRVPFGKSGIRRRCVFTTYINCRIYQPRTHDPDGPTHSQVKMAATPGAIKVKSPMSLAHVVLRTPNFQGMLDFYLAFLGAEISARNGDVIVFLRYDDEHHRIALLGVPSANPSTQNSAGLHHIAFSFETLDDLTLAYTQRKSFGLEPFWCVNHGPTTSMYYRDPDGNMLETQVDNFDTPEEANDFMASPLFRENPVGTDFDPQELIKRLESGEDHAVIKKRVEIGPRSVPPDA